MYPRISLHTKRCNANIWGFVCIYAYIFYTVVCCFPYPVQVLLRMVAWILRFTLLLSLRYLFSYSSRILKVLSGPVRGRINPWLIALWNLILPSKYTDISIHFFCKGSLKPEIHIKVHYSINSTNLYETAVLPSGYSTVLTMSMCFMNVE